MPNIDWVSRAHFANWCANFRLIVLLRHGDALARGSFLLLLANRIYGEIVTSIVPLCRVVGPILQPVRVIISGVDDACWGTPRVSDYHKHQPISWSDRQIWDKDVKCLPGKMSIRPRGVMKNRCSTTSSFVSTIVSQHPNSSAAARLAYRWVLCFDAQRDIY